jgi:hypothetical protein
MSTAMVSRSNEQLAREETRGLGVVRPEKGTRVPLSAPYACCRYLLQS